MNGVKILPDGMVQLPDGSVVSKEAFERILQGYKPVGGTPVGTERPVGPPIATTVSPASPQKPLDYMPTMTRPSRYDLLERNPNGMGGRIPPAAPTPEGMPERPTGQRYDMNRLRGRDMGADAPPTSPESEGRGLLDILLSANQKEEKPGFDWRMAGAGLLGMSPSEGMQRIGAMGMEQAGELRKEERALRRSNRTVDALVQAGMIKPEQAEALRSNPELISEFYKAALKGDDATVAKYKWLLANPEQAAKLKELGAIGGGINIDMGTEGDSKYWSEFAAGSAKAVNAAADELPALLEQRSQIALLQRLGAEMDAGATLVPAFLREAIPQGFNTAIDAYRGIAYGVAQGMRVEGTGAQSERDFDILLQRAGAANATPEARQIIQAGLQNALQMKIDLARAADNYRMADPANRSEQLAARTAYFEARKEILNRRLFTEEQLKVLGVETPESERDKLFEVLPIGE